MKAQRITPVDLEALRVDPRALSRETDQAACGQALARTGFPHQCNAFAGTYRQIDVPYQRPALIRVRKTDAQAPNLDERPRQCQIDVHRVRTP